MSEEKTPKMVRRWGYRQGESKIFEVEEGHDLPDGWYDSPAKVPDKKETPPKKAAAKKKPAETKPEPVEDAPDDDSA